MIIGRFIKIQNTTFFHFPVFFSLVVVLFQEMTTTDNKDEIENDEDIDDIDNIDDDIFSVTSSYKYDSTNDLGILSCAALITADCMGTGILALPYDINQVMGIKFGLFFLVINLFPINLYAGTILSYSADYVERKQQQSQQQQQQQLTKGDDYDYDDDDSQKGKRLLLQNNNNVQIYSSIPTSSISSFDDDDLDDDENINNNNNNDNNEEETNHLPLSRHHHNHHNHHHHDTATFDFIGMTSALFHSSIKTKCVLFLYYTNIFLVLGNYILVMSHAVVALFDNNDEDSSSSNGSDSNNIITSKKASLCIPTAGIIASTLMFVISQLRTMANLGRNVSILSLFALLIVVLQCLYYSGNKNGDTEIFIKRKNIAQEEEEMEVEVEVDNTTAILSTSTTTTSSSSTIIINFLSAMSSIGFATGSQKLFLNIRHECINRNKSPISLAIALFVFGTCYIIVVLLSGPDPPEFLFDAIPKGIQRRIAGFFLWVHVAVSYAINSQAICSSMDRIIFYNWEPIKHLDDYQRWIILTGMIAISAFVVANAIPFFKDLLAFIGAVTSVPLSLLLPAIYYRKVQGISILFPTKDSISSYSLLVFATLFMVLGFVASMTSILNDWEKHQGGFFSCQ